MIGGDPWQKPQNEAAWQPIDDSARLLGEVRVHRLGRFAWDKPEIATWRVEANGFKGWFTRQGEYLTPVPTHWMPLAEGGGLH